MLTHYEIDKLHESIRERVRGECRVVLSLIQLILKKGYVISVYDGESYPVKRSNCFMSIADALGNCDEEWIRIRTTDGESLGMIYLVYGNSADEVIADYTSTPIIDDIVAEVQS